MEVVDDDGVKDIIREELSKLGILGSPTQDTKKLGYGAKFLNKTVQGGIVKSVKNKKKPQGDGVRGSPVNSMKTDSKKTGSKSPFASSKNRNSTKKKNQVQQQQQAKVFGRALSECSDTNATLPDSNTVQVPAFLVDACNLLRRNITLEGLFRKAGSAARQNDIKRIVDSGESLPSSVHPVDVACLIKQFFRCLPEPLLEPSVHTRMLRCQLGLSDSEARVTGLLLSSLLLSVPNQHSLVYFLNFLHDVVSHSSTNRMDAYNLSVVLSPNLLPLSVPLGCSLPPAALQPSAARKGGRGPNGLSITEDNVLAANIDIMQELIVHQERVCRLPRDILAGLVTDRTNAAAQQQAQDAVDAALPQPPPHQPAAAAYAKNKKRRSASIHRLMSGLRRVVGVTMQPLHTGSGIPPNTNSPHPLHQHRVVQGPGSPCLPQYRLPSSPLLLCSPLHSPAPLPQGGRYQPPHSLSLHPMGAADVTSPGKRKSDVLARDGGCGDGQQPKKKARVSVDEDPRDDGAAAAAAAQPMSYAAVAATTPKLAPPPAPLLQKKESVTGVKVRRSHTTRESSSKPSGASNTTAFPRHPSLAAFLDHAPNRSKKAVKADKLHRRSLNSNLSGKLAGFGDRWAGKSEKAIRTSSVALDAGNKKSKASLVLYPYQSVEVQPVPESSSGLQMMDDIADKRAVTRSNSRRKSGVGPGMTQEEVVNLDKGSGGKLTVVENRPLHKSRSEVLSKTPSADSKTNRTPLKASKTDVNLKAPMTPRLGSDAASSVPCTPNLLCTPTTSSTSGLDACGGSLSATPVCLTPRHSTGRNSKRARRKARNARLALLSGGAGEPDGEASDGGGAGTPVGRGSRGVPDGAECILRDSPMVRASIPKASPAVVTLEHLEDQYDSIKSAVTSMELQIDCDSLQDMKQSSLFGTEISSIVSFNHNEIIQSAYDKMKKESSVLGMSPSENLSRRLDKELKIRRRRSGEGRVMRSPSERKIGTIRRRSKELELKVTRANSMLEKDVKSNRNHDTIMATPKMKDPLLLEPLMTPHSLKRGRPNSVRCGLPLVVRNDASPATRSVRKEALNVTDDKPLNNSVFYSDESEISRSNCSSTTSLPERVQKEVGSSTTENARHKSSSINSMSSMETSPGNMDDHYMPHLEPGVIMDDCFNPSLDTENEQWVPASDFLEQMKEDSSSAESTAEGDAVKRREKDGNRPSIAALKKQKKVTANVQLFNQLGSVTPGQRRQSRMMQQSFVTTPAAGGALPHARTAASERRQQQRAPAQRSRAIGRASLTPRHLATALRHHRPPSRVAVVSPLRENYVNTAPTSQLLPLGTPTCAPSAICEDSNDVVFKTPGPPPVTPMRSSRQSRALKVMETPPSNRSSRDYYL